MLQHNKQTTVTEKNSICGFYSHKWDFMFCFNYNEMRNRILFTFIYVICLICATD